MPCRTMSRRTAISPCAAPCRSMRRASPSSRGPPAAPAKRPRNSRANMASPTGVVIFDDVFVPHERVFLAGETEEGGFLTTSYATHHRHSCIGARAGFGDLLIGAGALMIEANGLDPERHGHIRDAMVELITITESFYRLRRRGVGLLHQGSGRLGHAGCGVLQYRQAAARDENLRHAPPGALRLGRPDRRPAGPGRGSQPARRAPHSPPCWAGGRTFPAEQRGWRWRA